MATREELLSLFGDDFDEVLKGLNALPVEVRQLLDTSLNNLVYDAEVFGQRINKVVQTQQARGIALSNIAGSLATDMQNKGRIFGELKNSIKSSLVEGVNQAGQAGSFAAYDPDENTVFTWITVAGHKICADCAPRGGQQGTLREWEERGMPGTGWSVCQGYCYCILDPSGKLSPRIQFEEVQEQGATARPTPTPPAAPLPKSSPIVKKTDNEILNNYILDENSPDYQSGWATRFSERYGKVSFEGVSKKSISSIAAAIDDTLGKYNIKVSHLGVFRKGMSARKAAAAAFRSKSNIDNQYTIGWQKSFLTGTKKQSERHQKNWLNKKKRNLEYQENRLKELKSENVPDYYRFTRDEKGKLLSIDQQIEITENIIDRYKNPKYDKWATYTVVDDPLYAVSKHEAWHQIDFQLNKNGIPITQGGTTRSLFGKQLKKFGVTQEEWYLVSEYAGSDIAELWAETGTALDMKLYVPENIKKAFIATIKEAGQVYQQ